MKDLLINSETGDLVIERRDLRLTDGYKERVADRLRKKLKLVRGEWFLDTGAGVPWFEDVLGKKNPRAEVVSAAIREPISQDPDVQEIVKFELSYENETRDVIVTVDVKLEGSGDVIQVQAQPDV